VGLEALAGVTMDFTWAMLVQTIRPVLMNHGDSSLPLPTGTY
jgi:hypothetical protein